MGKLQDVIGHKFGKFTILHRVPQPGKNTRYLCECECGVRREVYLSNLKKGGVSHCGCSPRETKRDRNLKRRHGGGGKPGGKHKTGHGEITGTFWSGVVHGALVRELEFSITIEFALDLIKSQGFRCALSGQPIYFAKATAKGSDRETASLDRKDSSIGYLPSNVQWVDKNVNRAKNTLSENEFIRLCKNVVDTYNAKLRTPTTNPREATCDPLP